MKPTAKTSVKEDAPVRITGYFLFPDSRTPYRLHERTDVTCASCGLL